MPRTLAIRNGTVHDGERFVGTCDLFIVDDKIMSVGQLGDDIAADKVLDASGCVVSPGFIDVHDMTQQVEQLDGNDAINLTAQGVTTCIIGNCGTSGIWDQVDTFLRQTDRLKRAKLTINAGNLVGHNSLRQFVLGTQSARIATPSEVGTMVSLLDDALAYGALGMSSGLMYAPGIFASLEEMVALTSAVGRHGKVYTSHIRDEGDGFHEAILEALDTAERAQASLVISHYKVAGKRNWGKALQDATIIEQRRQHQRVHVSFYLYDATSTVLRADLPSEIVRKFGGDYTHLTYSADDNLLVEEKGLHTLCLNSWSDVVIVTSSIPGTVGQSIADLASGQIPYAAVIDILRQDPDTRVVYHHVASEDELLAIAQLPYAMPASDGYVYPTGSHAATHPRNYGAFARVITHCVKAPGLLSLEDVICRATKLPAEVFNISLRGRLKAEYFADVAIFHPEEVRDVATYEQPYLLAAGMQQTVVNGQIVYNRGQVSGGSAGRYIS